MAETDPRSRKLVSAALFGVLGLVAAFGVSALAGVWRTDPVDGDGGFLGPALDDRAAVRVEVLNGAGTSGLARDATHRLRDDGFDVVFFGNADHFGHTRSVVVDRVGNPARARAVAAALGVDSVATVVDSSLMLEVTVVLGADWPPPTQAETDWQQRLRELFGGS